MDFAFDPRGTKYDVTIRKMFSLRKDTTVVQQQFINTVDDFFNYLANNVSTPLTNILLGSHGNEAGQMALEFTDGFGFTSYEALVFCIKGFKRKCQLVDKIINPRPLDPTTHQPIPAFIFIRGCRIGVAVPFLQKMKEVVNGLSTTPVSISAPKFFIELYDQAQGIFECFLYDFHAYMNTPFTTRDALIAELKLAKYSYKDIYGTAITDAQWQDWVPKDFKKTKDPLLSADLNPSPIANFPSLMSGRYKFERVPDILTWLVDDSVPAASIPKTKAAYPAFLKQQMNDRAAHPGIDDDFGLSLQSTHPFPFYVRNGYKSIEEMVDGMEWSQSKDLRTFKGARYEYTVSPPIIKNNNKNELIFNYYAAPGSGTTSSSMFGDNDPTYFQTV
jgi:hypothetical protein